ncbi:cytochrome c/ABC transporter substrate-binding protein [Pseudomonas jinjuensis]|uniref:ABC-type branched-chain amino acid transport system, substrate-binding protein n=1 Tax=Pseudomonas jinjuensis TaxID=198616 RepID=A0A1G9Z589_9PSED|nr:ABC transporter substrate-binding protein [Pseudomonas jinjuensis]SDN16424.1 ABC-type branched-chain amino acid transport system, substrate-binding protein [Pseudomonas jinjuensis]
MLRPVALLLGAWLAVSGPLAALELTPEEAAGKRVFQQGISASGDEISARVGLGSGMLLPASAVPCASCHGNDGRGRPEGGIRPPDITWQRLTTPYGQTLANGRSYPAYDAAAFGRAIGEGVDPAGNPLDPAMPRFVLSMRDQANLIAYLKRLQDERDPGIEQGVLRIGTLLPSSGPLAGVAETVAGVLNGGIESINEAGGIHGRRLELVVADPGADRLGAEAALRRLLDEEQVFALVAPLAPALGDGLGALLEPRKVPLLGVQSLFGASEDSPMVFEPLPGVREQILVLGNYASSELSRYGSDALVAYPLDDSQESLARNLAERLRGQGWSSVRLQGYRSGGPGAELAQEPVESVFFLGSAADFSGLAESFREAGQTPYLFAASTQVAGALARLPERFNGHLLLAYPFVPGDWTPAGTQALQAIRQRSGLDGRYAVMQVASYCSLMLLSEGLKRAGRDLSREKLVQALEGLQGFATGLTPPLGFGPGQRVGMDGAHVVEVDIVEQRFRPVGPLIRLDTPL